MKNGCLLFTLALLSITMATEGSEDSVFPLEAWNDFKQSFNLKSIKGTWKLTDPESKPFPVTLSNDSMINLPKSNDSYFIDGTNGKISLLIFKNSSAQNSVLYL